MGVVGGQGAGEEVGGVAVEVVPVAVVAAGGARVGVAEGVLDVLQRCAEPEGFGGVGGAEAVRGNPGGEARLTAEPAELGVRQPVTVGAVAGSADEDPAGRAASQ